MRATVKKVKIPIGSQNADLSEMFNQMLGTGNINITIAYPRYVRIKKLCEQLLKLFNMLYSEKFMKSPEFENEKRQLVSFCVESKKKMAEIFSMDFGDYEWNLTLVDQERQTQFTTVYNEMKKSELVNTFILVCDRLVLHKKNFIDPTKMNPKFITAMNGVEWCPFPFTTLNLKYIFSIAGKNTIEMIMLYLHKAYELTRMLYEETQAPDIDVDQFVDFIMTNIDEIQKRPELHRCREAFAKIKESVGMLKTRFNGYYRDFISTKDSTIMMQHFIIDVSKTTDASPRITNQFRQIIAYYRKIASSQISNPKIKMLFDRVNASFKELERGTENLVNIKKEEDTEDDSDIINAAAIPDVDVTETTGDTNIMVDKEEEKKED
jgi:hypothetical protein